MALLGTIGAFAGANLFKIQDAKLSELSAGATGAISTFDETNIESNVTFHKLDDSAKYTITLKNTDCKDHIIQSITDDNDNPYVSYEYSSYANTLVKAGDSIDFIVTAKYANAVTDKNARAQATNVKFFLKFADIDEPEELAIAPNTGDNIMTSVVVLAISAAGLIVCALIAIKRNKKHAKVFVAAIVAVSAVVATASVHAAKVETNSISITSNYGLYDKVAITWTDANGDEHEEFVPYNEPANIPDQIKPGHTFTGWEDENGNPVDLTEPITDDLNIHPTFRAHKYTIKFNGNGATGSMDSIEMTYGETKTLPASAFSFLGRTYAGWDTEANGSGVHHDDQAEVKNLTTEDNGVVTLYAQWSINPFYINYEGNGATSGEMATTNCEYDQSCILRENAFKKTGYHFIGWKYNNNDYTDKADVTNIIESGTITMVAQWAVNHYTIVFNINTDDANASGTMADMANLEYGTEYSLTANAFTRTGYNFDGWSTEVDGHSYSLTDAQLFRNLTTVDDDIVTLYAQWVPIHYNIVFHQNHDGVAGSTNSMTNVAYNETRTLSQNGFALEHYKYMGWNTATDGTGTPYEDGASIKNLTTTDGATIDLYAQWKERTAMLDTGANINKIMREQFTDAITFSHYTAGEPDFETITNEVDIALPTSNFPVYAWVDNGNLYWWSEADKPTMNVNSANFFNGVHNAGTASAPNNVANSLSKLESIDMTGLDASAAKDMTRLFANTKALNSLNLSDFDSSSATNMDGMFYGTALKNVDLSLIEAGNVTSMASMFQSTKFDALDFSNFDTHNVKLMSNMFTSAVMTNLDLSTLDTSSVTNMANMFKSSNITTLTFFDTENPTATKFDTSKVTTISEMFRESKTKTLDLSQFNTSAVTNMYGVFYSAAVSDLNVSNWDTSNVTSMYIMFFAAANLTSLNLSHFNTAKVTNMQQMFDSTTKLKYLNVSNWSNDKVTNMSYMFQDVGRGTAGEVTIVFDGFKTPSVTNMTRMFARYNDHNLKVLDLSSFDTSKVTSMGTMFGGGRQDTMIHNAMFDTIYVSDKFTNAGVSPTTEVFNRTSTVIGGAGTTWSQDHMTADYARIDDPDNGEPGYFTLKDSIYVRYHGNGSDDDSYEIMSSYYVSTAEPYDVKLKPNAFVREGYKFMGWATSANSTTVAYADGAALEGLTASKTPLELYAVWNKIEAIFNSNTSSTLNSIHSTNSDASKFKKYPNGQPSDEIIATATDVSRTDDPIWVWPDGENIYFWSEDPVPSFPSNMGSFFMGSMMTEIDLNGTDADVTSLYWTFVNAYSLKKIDFGDNFDTKRNTNMSGMFGYAYALETIEFGDKFSTENVTDMSWMFNSARSLKSADIASFDVSKVKNMSYMFTNGGGLEDLDLRSWNTASLTGSGLVSTFGSSRIKSIQFGENFNTNNVTSMANTFYGIRATSLDVSMFNTEKVTTMAGMFSGSAMTSLNLSNFSSAVLQNMDSMFKGMGNLTSITFGPNFTAEGVTNIASLFDGASSIEYLDLTGLHIPAQTNMNRTFMDMHKLKTLDITGWDLTHVTNTSNTFANEKVVETIYASSEFLPENLPSGGFEFGNWTLGGHLVGGAGTACTTNVSGVYARIDDPDNGNPGYFTEKNARYIRYDGNGADNAEYETMTSHYLTNTGSLKANAFVRDGYAFDGWNTAADGSGASYTDKQVMSELTESKTPLTLYAMWYQDKDFNGTVSLTQQYSSADVLQLSATMPQGYVGAAYFNPANLKERCSATSTNVADKEAKNGCMKWYIYGDDGTNYKMLLDHNTTARISFNSSNNNSNPQALLNQLSADTADWDANNLTIDIFTANEVAAIAGINPFNVSGNTASTGKYYPLDTHEINSTDGRGRSAHAWMYDYTQDCETHGCDYEMNKGYGYWTKTALGGSSKEAWLINYFGRLTITKVDLANWGIRPTVTISKSLVNAE